MKRFVQWMAALVLMLSMRRVAGAAEVPLGAGDVVRVSVYGNPDLSLETRVSEAGAITFPLLGQVPSAAWRWPRPRRRSAACSNRAAT